MSNVIGYARVSTSDQDLDIQLAALKAAGCDVIRAEKRSGASTNGRTELRNRARLHPQGRHAGRHPHRPAGAVDRGPSRDRPRAKAKGASLKATEQPIDTGSAAGRAFLQMLGVFAEFETAIRRERQMEGIAAAKAAASTRAARRRSSRTPSPRSRPRGSGRPRSPSGSKIGRASVYRVLEGV